MTEFDRILEEALSAWPRRLSLRIRRLPHKRYMVLGLTELFEEITESLGDDSRVLFLNMHWAIATAAQRSAAAWPSHILDMRPDGFRRDWIREKFENDLRSVLSHPDGWTAEDIALAQNYFAQG